MTTHRPKHSKGRLRLDHVDFLPIFDQFDEGVIIVDHRGYIRFYNDTMSKIDDLSVDFCLGKKVTEVYDLDDETSMIMLPRQPLPAIRPDPWLPPANGNTQSPTAKR